MFIDIHLHTVRKKSLPRNEKGANYASPEELNKDLFDSFTLGNNIPASQECST